MAGNNRLEAGGNSNNFRYRKRVILAPRGERKYMTNKMRTPEEIVNRIDEISESDFFGAIRDDLVEFLPFEQVRGFLKEGVTQEDWSKSQKPITKEAIVSAIADYMPFAWKKANGCRGISSNRSIDHMRAFLWLLNDGSLEKMEEIEYEHYGKEQLIFVCEHVDIDWKQYDDGVRTNNG